MGSEIMEKQIIEIIRQRDEYPYSLEISTNAKGEAQFSAKIRFETKTDKDVKDTFTRLLKEMKEAAKDQGFKFAGIKEETPKDEPNPQDYGEHGPGKIA